MHISIVMRKPIYSLEHYERLTELAIMVHTLWKSGVDVSSKGILNNSKHRKIISAAGWAGISWQEVLVAAGIPSDVLNKEGIFHYKYPMEHYDRLTVLALKVHKLWKNGVDVSSKAIQSNSKYRKLISAATFSHISWQEVLVAAGIPLDKIMKRYEYKFWPREHYDRLTVLALEVHKLRKKSLNGSSTAIQNRLEYGKLQSAARYMSITWEEVLVAAGIPLDK